MGEIRVSFSMVESITQTTNSLMWFLAANMSTRAPCTTSSIASYYSLQSIEILYSLHGRFSRGNISLVLLKKESAIYASTIVCDSCWRQHLELILEPREQWHLSDLRYILKILFSILHSYEP